jgi:hypothetical protein
LFFFVVFFFLLFSFFAIFFARFSSSAFAFINSPSKRPSAAATRTCNAAARLPATVAATTTV